MTLDLARFMFGGLFGTLAASTADQRTDDPLQGIAIFAIGVIVGLASVYFMDHLVRTRMHSEYERWVLNGRPERRQRKERRHRDERRAISQD